jgi:hypothetical protein
VCRYNPYDVASKLRSWFKNKDVLAGIVVLITLCSAEPVSKYKSITVLSVESWFDILILDIAPGLTTFVQLPIAPILSRVVFATKVNGVPLIVEAECVIYIAILS